MIIKIIINLCIDILGFLTLRILQKLILRYFAFVQGTRLILIYDSKSKLKVYYYLFIHIYLILISSQKFKIVIYTVRYSL